MATATMTTTTPPTPEAPARALEGPILQAMSQSVPEELATALGRLAERNRNSLAHAVNYRPHPKGMAGTIASVRSAVRELRHTEARRAFLARLAKGEASATFEPAEADPIGEAAEVLRGVLGQGPGAFGDLVKLVDARLLDWSGELTRLREAPGSLGTLASGALPLESVAWLRSEQGDPVAFLEVAAQKRARAAELEVRVDALAAARGRLEAAGCRRLAEVAASAGGVAALVEAIREAAALGDPGVSEGRARMLAERQAELAEVESSLRKLGVDPSADPATGGRATQALLAERAGLVEGIAAIRAGSASQEAADASALVDAALAFSPVAWAEVQRRAVAWAGAFAPGFAEGWGAVPLASLVEAGAPDFVTPFEAP